MNKNALKILINKPLSRRGLVTIRRLAWSTNKSIQTQEVEILRKHCGVKPRELNQKFPFLGYIQEVDPETGKINLKFDPMDVSQDYYL